VTESTTRRRRRGEDAIYFRRECTAWILYSNSANRHPADPGRLAQEHGQLQQQVIDLRLQLEERHQDLATARSANRELMAQLNHALRRSSRAQSLTCTTRAAHGRLGKEFRHRLL